MKIFKKLVQIYEGLFRTALVGTTATLIDLGVLALMVQVLGTTPQMANLPSLLAGSLVQFFGNRYYSFDGARLAAIHKQALGFFFAEGIAFLLNAGVYHFLVSYTPIPYVIARPIASGVIFLVFSYPVWRFMFDQKAFQKKLP